MIEKSVDDCKMNNMNNINDDLLIHIKKYMDLSILDKKIMKNVWRRITNELEKRCIEVSGSKFHNLDIDYDMAFIQHIHSHSNISDEIIFSYNKLGVNMDLYADSIDNIGIEIDINANFNTKNNYLFACIINNIYTDVGIVVRMSYDKLYSIYLKIANEINKGICDRISKILFESHKIDIQVFLSRSRMLQSYNINLIIRITQTYVIFIRLNYEYRMNERHDIFNLSDNEISNKIKNCKLVIHRYIDKRITNRRIFNILNHFDLQPLEESKLNFDEGLVFDTGLSCLNFYMNSINDEHYLSNINFCHFLKKKGEMTLHKMLCDRSKK
jgi:hypothetical protein